MTAAEREAEVHRCLPIVRHVARRVARVVTAADFDDLIGDGSVGLMRAIDSYDPTRGLSLDAYARRLILGAMLNGMRRTDPVSERVRRTIRRAERRRYAEANATGRLASMAELERDDGALRRARVSAQQHTAISIYAPLAVERGALADTRAEPAAVAQRRANREEIAQAIALLPDRQQRILGLHYGSDYSLHAIGTKLRVSPQRVSQLHRRAIARLRATLPAAADYR